MSLVGGAAVTSYWYREGVLSSVGNKPRETRPLLGKQHLNN
jgi:hypothetical protein